MFSEFKNTNNLIPIRISVKFPSTHPNSQTPLPRAVSIFFLPPFFESGTTVRVNLDTGFLFFGFFSCFFFYPRRWNSLAANNNRRTGSRRASGSADDLSARDAMFSPKHDRAGHRGKSNGTRRENPGAPGRGDGGGFADRNAGEPTINLWPGHARARPRPTAMHSAAGTRYAPPPPETSPVLIKPRSPIHAKRVRTIIS